MNQIWYFFEELFKKFRIWTTVAPWEQGIRVRLGKHVKLLAPGLHFIFPLTDRLYLQSTRVRMTSLGRQTVTTLDGHAVTVSGAIQYSIKDILRLYETVQQPDETIRNTIQARIGRFISTHSKQDCITTVIEKAVTEEVKLLLPKWGLGDIDIFITEFVIVRTYRVLTGENQSYTSEELNTTRHTT